MRKKLLKILILFLISCLPCCAVASEAVAFEGKAAVLIDAASGRVIFGINENEMLPEASCTKIMTALLALENSALDEMVVAGSNAAGVTGTSLYLSEGEALTMEQMLYGIMLRSGNDAAVAVAEYVSGDVPAFAEMANARSKELNADAHFVNPHGLDADGHAASALGLARIMREALRNPTFRMITGTKRKVIPWVGNEYSRVRENKNRLLTSYEGATGGKTGFTNKAGRCLVFSAERNDMELIGAVLHCYTWFDTAESILDYGFDNYHLMRGLSAGETAVHVQVYGGTEETVSAVADADLSAAVRNGSRTEVVFHTEPVNAPIESGEPIGTAVLMEDGIAIAECALTAGERVDQATPAAAFLQIIRNWLLRPLPRS